MKLKGSVACPQEAATGPYLERDEYISKFDVHIPLPRSFQRIRIWGSM
jgi:hypothetical protein